MAVSERSLLRGRLYFKAGEARKWTVDDALEYVGIGPFHVLLCLMCGCVFMSDAVEVMVLGRPHRAKVLSAPPFDPEGRRLRA